MGDLSSIYRGTWEQARAEFGGSPWGLTKQQFEQTRDIKSVLSVPLVTGDRVRGVLNLDDRATLTDALFDAREVLRIIGGYRYHIEDVLYGDKGGYA